MLDVGGCGCGCHPVLAFAAANAARLHSGHD